VIGRNETFLAASSRRMGEEEMREMRNLAVVVGLALGISVLGAAVPVAEVQYISPGYFWVWVQNTEPCGFDNFKLVFAPKGITVKALVINGPAVQSLDVKSGVVKVKLEGALKTGGWLVLGVGGVPTMYTADTLLKYNEAFTAPPRCR